MKYLQSAEDDYIKLNYSRVWTVTCQSIIPRHLSASPCSFKQCGMLASSVKQHLKAKNVSACVSWDPEMSVQPNCRGNPCSSRWVSGEGRREEEQEWPCQCGGYMSEPRRATLSRTKPTESPLDLWVGGKSLPVRSLLITVLSVTSLELADSENFQMCYLHQSLE